MAGGREGRGGSRWAAVSCWWRPGAGAARLCVLQGVPAEGGAGGEVPGQGVYEEREEPTTGQAWHHHAIIAVRRSAVCSAAWLWGGQDVRAPMPHPPFRSTTGAMGCGAPASPFPGLRLGPVHRLGTNESELCHARPCAAPPPLVPVLPCRGPGRRRRRQCHAQVPDAARRHQQQLCRGLGRRCCSARRGSRRQPRSQRAGRRICTGARALRPYGLEVGARQQPRRPRRHLAHPPLLAP